MTVWISMEFKQDIARQVLHSRLVGLYGLDAAFADVMRNSKKTQNCSC